MFVYCALIFNPKKDNMSLFKKLLVIMLISTVAFSCKSDKKVNSDGDQVEMSETATDDATGTNSESTETSKSGGEDSKSEVKAVQGESKGVEEVKSDESVDTDTKDMEAKDAKISVVYPKDPKLVDEVEKAIKHLVTDNPSLKEYFQKAYGFVVFPVITKAGLGIGGAGGKGLTFQTQSVIGLAKIAQATFGLQAGGQQYAEVIFFEDKSSLDKFKSGKLKFSGQVSAVALKKGVSHDVDYQDGVAIFTKVKGGIMAEASVGGQKFTYKDGI